MVVEEEGREQEEKTPPKSGTLTAPNSECAATGTLVHCWWKRRMARPLWNSPQFLTALNILGPYDDPATAPLGIHPNELETDVHT